jgi:hypothetical protein
VDSQGEKYIYSTLFVKINWSMTETMVLERLGPAKLEKRSSRGKARLVKLNSDGNRSETSIDSSGSSMLSIASGDDGFRGDRESLSGMDLKTITEVNAIGLRQ